MDTLNALHDDRAALQGLDWYNTNDMLQPN